MKDNVQHTPGPWTAKEYHGVGVLGVFGPPHADGGDYAPIVSFLNRGGIDLANARLIAAAPELLEACALIVRQYGGYPPATSDGPLNAARAAIAKADGKDRP